MFRVYAIFYFEKTIWAASEQTKNTEQKEKTVSNSSEACTDQVRNIDTARNNEGRSLLSANRTVLALTNDSVDQNTDVQTICNCATHYHHRQQYRYQNNLNNVTSQSGAPKRESQHRQGQMGLKMSSKDISSPTLTHTSTKNLSFSPRHILNRVTLTNESIKSFSSNTSNTTANSRTKHKLKKFFSKDTKKENSLLFTKKLKRVFSFHK